ncbi:KUP/HAK/KT family potassium transporter [Undibacterium sp. Ren11W]|uniref:KUP/HAK/KT family potassium transporter n=1 Tax=Undibacterium sp. Ren11W TaxID=3413045 RepID=UPI003BF226B7
MVARYGYMEETNVPALLELATQQTGRDSLALPAQGNFFYRALLRFFIWLDRNELDAASYFGIPPERVMELGARLELVLPETQEVTLKEDLDQLS